MNWIHLHTLQDLDAMDEASRQKPVLLLKHSHRCSISATVLNRFERQWPSNAPLDAYMVDVLAHRQVSDEAARRYGVEHESPQALVIRDGKCVNASSHMEIRVENVLRFSVAKD